MDLGMAAPHAPRQVNRCDTRDTDRAVDGNPMDLATATQDAPGQINRCHTRDTDPAVDGNPMDLATATQDAPGQINRCQARGLDRLVDRGLFAGWWENLPQRGGTRWTPARPHTRAQVDQAVPRRGARQRQAAALSISRRYVGRGAHPCRR
jgi:hypothetical protein